MPIHLKVPSQSMSDSENYHGSKLLTAKVFMINLAWENHSTQKPGNVSHTGL
jgi:hypothetical protein